MRGTEEEPCSPSVCCDANAGRCSRQRRMCLLLERGLTFIRAGRRPAYCRLWPRPYVAERMRSGPGAQRSVSMHRSMAAAITPSKDGMPSEHAKSSLKHVTKY